MVMYVSFEQNEDYKMNPSKYSGISTGGGVSEPSPPLQNKFPRKGSSQLKGNSPYTVRAGLLYMY